MRVCCFVCYFELYVCQVIQYCLTAIAYALNATQSRCAALRIRNMPIMPETSQTQANCYSFLVLLTLAFAVCIFKLFNTIIIVIQSLTVGKSISNGILCTLCTFFISACLPWKLSAAFSTLSAINWKWQSNYLCIFNFVGCNKDILHTCTYIRR